MSGKAADEEEKTQDALFGGRLVLSQSRRGYRYSIDAPILAHFAAGAVREPMVDLGAGCGVIALILAFKFGLGRITALELQPGLAALAARNVAANHLEERITVFSADLTAVDRLPAASAAGVVCNPPYRGLGTGRVNPATEKALARHELAAELPQIVAAAAHLLTAKGRFFIIYPAPRLAALFSALARGGLEPKRLRPVHSFAAEDAVLVLVEALKGGGEGLRIEPPLVIYGSEGRYGEEVSSYFEADPDGGGS
ncbi:MAG: methyltransferase [Pseudomonadota bacterium]